MKKEDPCNGYYNPNSWVIYPLHTTNNQGFGHCSNHFLTMIFWDLLVIEGFGIYFDQNLNNTKGMTFFVVCQ